MAVAIIKATIWLEVRHEANIPTETKADPNKINPRYWFFRNVFTRRFLEVEKGIIDTWDYSLVATLWRQDMKFLQFNGNSVVNVGFDHRATHTKGRAPSWVPITYSKNISKNN